MRYATLWTIERTKTTGSGRAASILDDRGVLTRVERRLAQASFNVREGVWELEQSSNVRPLHKGRGGEDSDETCEDFEGHAGGPGQWDDACLHGQVTAVRYILVENPTWRTCYLADSSAGWAYGTARRTAGLTAPGVKHMPRYAVEFRLIVACDA